MGFEAIIKTPNESFDSENLNSNIYNDGSIEPTAKEQNPGIIDKNDLSLNYFGYDIFRNGPKLLKTHLLRPWILVMLLVLGDEIIIMLWGETEFNQSFVVTKDGYLRIENLGQGFVNGLTL